ncbi:helix-turn-helix domain-containing protein [Hydrogenophaga sp. ZJX-1]|uniref:helix-turn-helix domain-containing protein n=1 Tax=Hydrogenophaga sp. ZJX-1 TaxID=3404778 RepID=UPI003B2881FF
MAGKNTSNHPESVSPPSPNEKFGELLRALRADRGETQTRLSKRAGISVGHLCEIETGKRPPPSPAVFKRLVESLGLTELQIQQLALPAFEHELSKGHSHHLPDLSRKLIEHVLRVSSVIDLHQALAIQSILNKSLEQGGDKRDS